MEEFIYTTLTDSCRTIFRINAIDHTLQILKYRNRIPAVPEAPQDISSFMETLIQSQTIYEYDLWKLRFFETTILDPETVLKNRNYTFLIIRHKEDARLRWCRIACFFPKNFGAENPFFLLISTDIEEDEALRYDSSQVFLKNVHKVAQVNFATNEYWLIHESRSEALYRRKQKPLHYQEEINLFADTSIHPEDRESFLKITDSQVILNHFAAGNSSYCCYYRRKIQGLYRWVKLMVAPASGCSKETPLYHLFVIDEHREILKMIDINNVLAYNKRLHWTKRSFSDAYYNSFMDVLYSLTETYVDYYLIDLEQDIFVRYKSQSGILKDMLPQVGSYTETSEAYIRDYATGENAASLKAYCTSKKLQALLTDRMTLSYTFTDPTGALMCTTVRKLESQNQIPTKAICHTVRVENERPRLIVRTFGNFEVFLPDKTPFKFSGKRSRQLFAYLIDRQGFPVTTADIATELLEKDSSDLAAIKYASTMIHRMIADFEKAGFSRILLKENKSIRVDVKEVDCDYYRLLAGDTTMWDSYHNEYMKEYSFAEYTNAEILEMASI